MLRWSRVVKARKSRMKIFLRSWFQIFPHSMPLFLWNGRHQAIQKHIWGYGHHKGNRSITRTLNGMQSSPTWFLLPRNASVQTVLSRQDFGRQSLRKAILKDDWYRGYPTNGTVRLSYCDASSKGALPAHSEFSSQFCSLLILIMSK